MNFGVKMQTSKEQVMENGWGQATTLAVGLEARTEIFNSPEFLRMET